MFDTSTWHDVPSREHTSTCFPSESVMYRFLPNQSTASPSTIPTPMGKKKPKGTVTDGFDCGWKILENKRDC